VRDPLALSPPHALTPAHAGVSFLRQYLPLGQSLIPEVYRGKKPLWACLDFGNRRPRIDPPRRHRSRSLRLRGWSTPVPARQLVAISVQPSNGDAVAPSGTIPFAASGTFDQAPTTEDSLAVQWSSSARAWPLLTPLAVWPVAWPPEGPSQSEPPKALKRVRGC
jgi:hypothetical protein